MKLHLGLALAIHYALAYKTVLPMYRVDDCEEFNQVHSSILDDKLYLFKSEIWLESMTAQMIIGQIDLENSISIDDYSSRWWVVGNMTTGNVITGTSSRILFTAANLTMPTSWNDTFATFDPETSTLDADLPWPLEIPRDQLLLRVPQITIPEQNITYHIGLAGTNSTRLVKYDIVRDTWDILNSPNKSWESGTFIPIGRKGIVVMIGVADDEPDVAVPMNEVYIHDIASQTWHRQSTGGTTPPPRLSFCVTTASAQDGSSHQIHVYGGYYATNGSYPGQEEDSHWILSIPSFNWIQAPPAPPREAHSCIKYGSRKMLVIGGWGDTGRNTGWGNSTVKACHEFLQILDLSTLKLISDFSDEPYEVPSVVTKVIGGNAKGGATLIKPSGGFLPGVESVLSQPYELVNKSNTGDTDNLQQSGSSTKSDNPPPKRLLGAIIGGVLAGIVSFCIIGAVICIKAKRHQTSDTHAELEGRSQLVEMENSGQRAELPGDNPPGNQGSAIELCACDDRSEDTGRLSEHESDGGKGIGTSVVGKC